MFINHEILLFANIFPVVHYNWTQYDIIFEIRDDIIKQTHYSLVYYYDSPSKTFGQSKIIS